MWRNKLVRKTALALRIPQTINAHLHSKPINSELFGVKYRFRSLETWSLLPLIQDQYPAYIFIKPVRSFVDLGSNAGLFPLWMMRNTPIPRQLIKGLCIDANSDMLEDCKWHLENNGLTHCIALTGLVGVSGKCGTFHVHRSNVSSSAKPSENPNGWRPVNMPTINVEEAWINHFGNTQVDLLKMNIEGVELDFFRLEKKFLERVRQIVVEVHAFGNSINEVDIELGKNGFFNRKTWGERGYEFCLYSRKAKWDEFSDVQDKNQDIL